jgi:hypothetical protein
MTCNSHRTQERFYKPDIETIRQFWKILGSFHTYKKIKNLRLFYFLALHFYKIIIHIATPKTEMRKVSLYNLKLCHSQ